MVYIIKDNSGNEEYITRKKDLIDKLSKMGVSAEFIMDVVKLPLAYLEFNIYKVCGDKLVINFLTLLQKFLESKHFESESKHVGEILGLISNIQISNLSVEEVEKQIILEGELHYSDLEDFFSCDHEIIDNTTFKITSNPYIISVSLPIIQSDLIPSYEFNNFVKEVMTNVKN